MSTVKIYTGIGIFNPANILVAQGSQELKFTGSVVVSRIGDQTVVEVSSGSGNLDGGKPDSNYGAITPVNGGVP